MSSVFNKVFLDQAVLKYECDSVSLGVLETALKNLQEIVDERKAKESIRNQKITEYLRQLEADGIDPSELMPNYSPNDQFTARAKRAKRPAKYQYTMPSGEVKTWTGQGRTPLPIQQHINHGGSIDDFLIH